MLSKSFLSIKFILNYNNTRKYNILFFLIFLQHYLKYTWVSKKNQWLNFHPDSFSFSPYKVTFQFVLHLLCYCWSPGVTHSHSEPQFKIIAQCCLLIWILNCHQEFLALLYKSLGLLSIVTNFETKTTASARACVEQQHLFHIAFVILDHSCA